MLLGWGDARVVIPCDRSPRVWVWPTALLADPDPLRTGCWRIYELRACRVIREFAPGETRLEVGDIGATESLVTVLGESPETSR